MSLSAGTRLGPYEIVATIGHGGMGEVYRARDTRLDRTVALKVLPPELASDGDRRQRFEREARAIAALEHPHICPLYDVGQHDGTHFLVMPYLDGETLAARLNRTNGPLTLDQVLQTGIAIARALDRAHRAGITHRDLKPGNVMLTKAGPKLLDFGLAKLAPPVGPISMSEMTGPLTAGPTTAQGTILGTLPYMAPEQVEGREADTRSDVWALGAVLYEMATGTRPFVGDTPASIIGAILKDSPSAVSVCQPMWPRALDHLVERCLAKDPDERWQSIGDVGRFLESINATHTDVKVPPAAVGRSREIIWMTAAALLGLALAGVVLRPAPVAPADSVVRLAFNPPADMVFAAHKTATVPVPQFAVSPDGRSIAFIAAVAPGAARSLWVRALEEDEARSFPGTEDALEPVWSPDSRWILFFDEQGRMRKVAVSGGTVQTVANNLPDPRGASWGADDTILFGMGYEGIFRIPAAGGRPEAVTQLDASRQEGSHRWPQFLPDGRHYLFTIRSGLLDQRGIYVGALGSQTRQRLLASDGDARYVRPGYLLYLDGETLLAQSFDHERREFVGQAVPIAGRVGRSSRGNGAFSASWTGTVAHAAAMLRPGRLAWFDRRGAQLGVVGPDGEHDYADFRLSLDETRLAVSLVDAKLSLPDIWVMDLVRGGTSRFTFGPQLNAAAVWSPKGDRIVFRANRKGLTELYDMEDAAGDRDQPLLSSDRARENGVGSSNLYPSDWSRDGRHVVFSANSPSDLWVLPIAANAKPIRVVGAPADQMHGNFSPDGQYLAYTSNESGRFEVYAETFPPTGRKWTISTAGGYEPRWRADGREMYYLSADHVLMSVEVSSGTTPFGVPRPLFQTRVHADVSMLRTHYIASRDGNRFLVHVRSRDVPPGSITIVANWTSMLQR